MSGPDAKPDRGAVTQLLAEMRNGDGDALNRLFPLVYAELRRVAANLMRQERSNHTLQPTALVNEAYLRLAASPEMSLVDRAHFFAVAARVMRQALVQHARVKHAQKRGGKQAQVELDDAMASVDVDVEQVIAVDEALQKLEALDARQAKIVEMQYFIGNSIEEIAAATGTSERTAKRELQTGRLFLAEQLHSQGKKLTPLGPQPTL
jgi:RNA polymerase sigma-70 factor (ECF subfamily)